MPALRRRLVLGALAIGTSLPLQTIEADEPAEAPSEPAVRQVGEVTVTATRAERDVLETPGHVTVITREEIDESGARDVPELLRREAGIFVANGTTNAEGYSSWVDARGFSNGSGGGSSLLVLVDGRRVNEADSSRTDWTLVQLDYVDRIEIVRGPASAVYGDNAVAGVVQIITRRPEGPPTVTLRGRTGTYDTDGGSIVASGEQGPLGFSFFTDYGSSDGYRDRSDLRAHDVEGKLRLQLGDSAAATLIAGYVSDKRDRPGSLSAEDIEALGRRAGDPRFTDDFDRVRRRFVQGVFELAPSESVSLELVPFYRRRNDRAAISSTLFGRTQLATETDAFGMNSQARIDLPLAGRESRLLFGVDLLREDLESRSLSGGPFVFERRSRRDSWGVFVQEELNLTPELLLTAGLRFDEARYDLKDFSQFSTSPATVNDTDPDYDLWSPRAAVLWSLAEGASAYVSYGRGFRFPNLDETSGVFAFNPRIRPQRSHSYEAGFKMRRARVDLDLAIYQMNVEDEILLDSDVINTDFGDPLLSTENVNMERVRHRGLEAALAVRPAGWIEVYGSYTYDNTKILRDRLTNLDGKQVPLTPRHRGTYGVRLFLPAWIELALNGNLVGGRYAFNDFGHDFGKLSKFAVYDAFFAFRPEIGDHVELAFTVAVRNVFDREYEELAGREQFPDLADFLADPDAFFRLFPSPDRNYLVGLALTVRR